MRRILVIASSTVVLAASMSSPALANHTPGATYNGTVTGGGTVTFTISSDGSSVTPFVANNVPGSTCTFTSATAPNIPIVNHAFSSTSSIFSVTGSFPQPGTASGTLSIQVGAPANCSTGTRTWSASRPNSAPTLNAIGNKTTKEGQTLSFTLSATDPDGDPLTYSASNLPPGAAFNSSTHTFTWTPDFNQAGSYPGVHFQVVDPQGAADSEDITITVENAEKAASTTTLAVTKTAHKVKGAGKVQPGTPTGNVTVTLYRKQGGGFHKLGAKPAGLQSSGAYSAAFPRPDPGACKMTAKFGGDAGHLGSSATKSFSC